MPIRVRPPGPSAKPAGNGTEDKAATLPAELIIGERTVACGVSSMSAGGARITVDGADAFPRWAPVILQIEDLELSGFVSWLDDSGVGIAFADDPDLVQRLTEGDVVKLKDPKDRRQFPRCSVLMSGSLRAEGDSAQCVIQNISLGGAKIRILRTLAHGGTVTLNVPKFGDFSCDVAWESGELVGLRFTMEPDAVAGRIAETLPRCLPEGFAFDTMADVTGDPISDIAGDTAG